MGSVARGDTGPASDLDLVLVHDGRRPHAEVAALADRLWYPLWDSGLRVDHSVRTPSQCREVAAVDASAGIGLLDLRPLAGDHDLVVRTRAQLLADWRGGIRRRLPALLDVLVERVERFGEIANLLEPDLKEARGGLRDVTVLRALAASWATDRPHGEVDAAHTLLLDVRDALHVVTGRGVDRLLLADQDAVAVAVGVDDADELLTGGRAAPGAPSRTPSTSRCAGPGRRCRADPAAESGCAAGRAVRSCVRSATVSSSTTARWSSAPACGRRPTRCSRCVAAARRPSRPAALAGDRGPPGRREPAAAGAVAGSRPARR